MSRTNLRRVLRLLAACVLATLVTGAATPSWAVSFTLLRDTGGSFTTRAANGVSADGQYVAGNGNDGANNSTDGFRWSGAGGFDALAGLNDSITKAISADASAVAGRGIKNGMNEAFRWNSTLGQVFLGDLPGGTTFSSGEGVSGDGSVVVGQSYSAAGLEAFRWTQQTGMLGLGDLPGGQFSSSAWGVSDDGLTIVGSGSVLGGFEAFRWTSNGGMQGLGDLPGGDLASTAYGVSADGSVVVGEGSGAAGTEAFVWNAVDGLVGIGDPASGFTATSARAVSANGKVVVGRGIAGGVGQALIWDEENGLRQLRDAVGDAGVDLDGWTLNLATGVSADGSVVVGEAIHTSGASEAFMVTLVESSNVSGDYNNDGVVDAADYTVWRDASGTTTPLPNDPNGGVIGQSQYDTWRTSYAGAGSSIVIPEPTATTLLGVGLINLPARRRRRS